MKHRPRGSALLWRAIAAAALLSTALMLFGFAYALQDVLNPAAPAGKGNSPALGERKPQREDKSVLNVVALGDSLTKGTGDVTGQGYVRRVVAGLSEQGMKAKLVNNLAINGLRTDQLIEKLEKDEGTRYALKQADLILFTIGGNDLSGLLRTVLQGGGELDMGIDKFTEELQAGIGRLETIFKRIHEVNGEAKVIYVGLYNPFYPIPELRPGSLQVQNWNNEAYRLSVNYPNMRLVPTFDLFESEAGVYLGSDRFHPNGEGYQHIAERVLQVLQEE